MKRSIVATGIALNVVLFFALVLTAREILGLGSDFAIRALLALAVSGVVVSLGVWLGGPTARFGLASIVTFTRVSLVALILALLGETAATGIMWLAVCAAIVALVLDGLDGRLARRFAESSRFGARFDMETDAALILVMALLIWQIDRTGAWILAAGALRYVFIAASVLVPWMQRSLPASRRRQAVCVVQVVSLILCLAPVVPGALAPIIGLVGLTCLAASFLIDTAWLWRVRAPA
jgi:phosphatidylglycerophosphate synthase